MKKTRILTRLGAFGIAALATVSLMSVVPTAAQAEPAKSGPDCSSDSVYLMSNLWNGGESTPGQILEYPVDSDGNVDVDSWSVITDPFESNRMDPNSASIVTLDALGLSQDCTFYFVANNDWRRVPANVDIYRFNPGEDSTPQRVHQSVSMSSPIMANIVAGGVAPNGDYYYGSISRNNAADASDAENDVVRFHLSRYVYTPDTDPASTTQPNARTGEVAIIDIKVDPDVYSYSDGTLAEFGMLWGDITFAANGDLILFTGFENPGFETNEQLSAVIPASVYEALPGNWRIDDKADYVPVPHIEALPARYSQNPAQPVYMGAAFTGTGELLTMSIGENADPQGVYAAFNQVDPVTLDALPGSERISQISPTDLDPDADNEGRRFYPFDLASTGLAATLNASLTVAELADAADTFSLEVSDSTDVVIGSVATATGETAAQLQLPATPGDYTITETIDQAGDAYDTAWACTDEADATVASGSGLTATVAVGAGQSVDCAFTNTIKLMAVTPVDPAVTQAERDTDGKVIDPIVVPAATPGIDYTLSSPSPKAGDTVIVTATPQAGYKIDAENLPKGWVYDSKTGTASFTVELAPLDDQASGKPEGTEKPASTDKHLATTGSPVAPLAAMIGAGLLLAVGGATVVVARGRAKRML